MQPRTQVRSDQPIDDNQLQLLWTSSTGSNDPGLRLDLGIWRGIRGVWQHRLYGHRNLRVTESIQSMVAAPGEGVV